MFGRKHLIAHKKGKAMGFQFCDFWVPQIDKTNFLVFLLQHVFTTTVIRPFWSISLTWHIGKQLSFTLSPKTFKFQTRALLGFISFHSNTKYITDAWWRLLKQFFAVSILYSLDKKKFKNAIIVFGARLLTRSFSLNGLLKTRTYTLKKSTFFELEYLCNMKSKHLLYWSTSHLLKKYQQLLKENIDVNHAFFHHP